MKLQINEEGQIFDQAGTFIGFITLEAMQELSDSVVEFEYNNSGLLEIPDDEEFTIMAPIYSRNSIHFYPHVATEDENSNSIT